MGGAGMAGVAAAAVCYDEDAVTERQWSRAVDNAQDLDQLRSVRTVRSLPHVPRCLPACLPACRRQQPPHPADVSVARTGLLSLITDGDEKVRSET
jgi:hypothetical protein